MKISFFKHITQTDKPANVELLKFLSAVKEGKWQDFVLQVRNEENKEKRSKLKTKLLPYVTISGTFSQRREAGLQQHSGFIAIDIDDIPEQGFNLIRETLEQDEHSYSVFTSVGGFGLVVLVKIDSNRHLDAFEALEKYYLDNYGVVIDKSCKDKSRPRFVSYDPDLHLNQSAKKFTQYLPKKKVKEYSKPSLPFTNRDIEQSIEFIRTHQIDIIQGSYERWRNVGFAFADTLGEEGREAFHLLSQYDGKYEARICEKQYDKCLNAKNSGVTIGTFFYYCQEANVPTRSEETIKIINSAIISKQGGNFESAASASESFKTFNTIEDKEEFEIDKIFNEVYSNKELKTTEISNIERLELFLKSNYAGIKRNVITTRLELESETLGETAFNSIWRQANKKLDKDVSFESVKRVLGSDFVEDFNPVKDWFEINNTKKKERGHIKALADCIESPTGFDNENFYPQYKEVIITSWLVGMISMIYGVHSPLLLMLVGKKQGTGKTEFFRRLLPKALYDRYFAECKFVDGKDDFIRMCENIIILNDEFDGRTINNEKLIKQILSAQNFYVRSPYSAFTEKRLRIAALCGTSNEVSFIKDPTGNRRILPIEVESIDFKAYNSIDKTKLLIEAYQLYLEGYEWEIKGDVLEKFNESSSEFNYDSIEHELISAYLVNPEFNKGDTRPTLEMTAAEILSYIQLESSNNKLSKRKLSLELTKLGFEKIRKKVDGVDLKCYRVIKKY